MKPTQKAGEFQMKAGDFDRIMRKALQAKPENAKPKKGALKPKTKPAS